MLKAGGAIAIVLFPVRPPRDGEEISQTFHRLAFLQRSALRGCLSAKRKVSGVRWGVYRGDHARAQAVDRPQSGLHSETKSTANRHTESGAQCAKSLRDFVVAAR